MRIIKKPHSTLPPAIHSECVRFTKYRKNSKPGLFECSSALRLIFCLQNYSFFGNAATKPRKFILFSCCSCNPNNIWRNRSLTGRRSWGASRCRSSGGWRSCRRFGARSRAGGRARWWCAPACWVPPWWGCRCAVLRALRLPLVEPRSVGKQNGRKPLLLTRLEGIGKRPGSE